MPEPSSVTPQPQAIVVVREGDLDLRRIGVLDGVVDGLLRDAEEVGGRGVIGHADVALRAEPAGHVEDALRLVGELLEGVHQPLGLHVHGREEAGEVAHLSERPIDEGRKLASVLRFGPIRGAEPLRENLTEERGAGELLPELVVEVLPDPAALELGRLDHLALQPFPLGHVEAAGEDARQPADLDELGRDEDVAEDPLFGADRRTPSSGRCPSLRAGRRWGWRRRRRAPGRVRRPSGQATPRA